MAETSGMNNDMRQDPVVALLPWGNVIEDFLDSIGVTLQSFCTTQTGGWLFGYISALGSAGIQTHLICVSGRVHELTHFTHIPTGARVSVLPASSSYLRLRRIMNREKEHPVRRGITRRLLRAGAGELLPYLATPLRLLVAELRRTQCSAIICQEYEYPRFDACVMAGRLLGIPVFGSYQGSNSHSVRLEAIVRPLSMRLCRGLIIGSGTERARVSQSYDLQSSKIARIFNPLDVEAWHANDRLARRQQLGFNDESGVVVWHGRVDFRRKGLDTLLDAWKVVEETKWAGGIPRLLLVGSGDNADLLREGIAGRGLTGVVWRNQYLLDHEEIRGYLAAADLYVLPSRHEGFAVAPLEAMACGLPIVATDVSGIRDLLEEGEFSGGIIVSPNDPVQLANAILRMLCDPQFRRTLGERARRRVERNFSWRTVGRELRAFMLDSAAAATGFHKEKTRVRRASRAFQSNTVR